MTRHTELLIATLAVLAAAAGAQTPGQGSAGEPPAAHAPIELAPSDVFFTSRWFRGNPSEVWSAMCGFAIHGNYLSRDVPRPVWELNIEEFMDGATPVIALSIDGESETLTARIVGQPSSVNAIKALLETAPGQRLLTGLYDGRLITISLGYQDGATAVLRVRNWKDRSHVSGFEHYLEHCTRLLHPLPPGVPSNYRIDSPIDLTLQSPFGHP